MARSSSIFFHHRNLSVVISIFDHYVSCAWCYFLTHIASCWSIVTSLNCLLIPCSIFIILPRVLGEALKLVFQFMESVFCALYSAIHHFTGLFTFENLVFRLKASSPGSKFPLCRDAALIYVEFATWCVLIYILNMQFRTCIFRKFLVTNLCHFGNLTLLRLLVKWIFSCVWWMFTFGGRSRERCLFIFLKYYDGFAGNFIDLYSHAF